MYDFVTIDFETANNMMNSACSVGIVAVKNLEIVKTDYFMIKPPTDHFRRENIDIHGIKYEDVKDCERFPYFYEDILTYIKKSWYVIAHNAQFDMSVLRSCIEHYCLEMPEFIYIDSINLSAQVKRSGGNSLEDCAKFFNIKLESHHEALCDAETCARIVIKSIKCVGFGSIAEYIDSYPGVNRKVFSELKSNRIMPKSRKIFHSIKPSEITTTATSFNKSNAFFQKNCVITGEFESISRREAMQKIVDVGGIVKTCVSSKTNYLIVGKQDKQIVGEDGLSTKEEKAYSLIENGADIVILNENEFLSILSKEELP